ncbi:hypothetical protein LX36DRAFT_649649 [Colletotrichum falcatum]|nr:hypothetical protein LX36DRAFT_649649 [Colletotrichum falcatum]
MKTFASVLVASFAVLAQAVKLTNNNFDVEAGQPFTITWSDAQGPVTLTLKNGPSTNLVTVQSIASKSSVKRSAMNERSKPDHENSWPERYFLHLDSSQHPSFRHIRH